MKLSEAIRLGAMLRPQLHVGFHCGGGSCVLGAVAEASGLGYPLYGSEQIEAQVKLRALYPILDKEGVWLEIVGRNHNETRERIADWVESIEPKEVQTNQEVAHDPAPVAVPASGRG